MMKNIESVLPFTMRFADNGLMHKRYASINDLIIKEIERKLF